MAALVPQVLDAQTTIRLGEPETRSRTSFVSVSGAVRLANGSVIVADPGDGRVFLVQRSGNTQQVGRVGSGPGEYRQPQRLLPFGRNRAVLIDPSLKRLSFFDSAAVVSNSMPFPPSDASFALAEARAMSDNGVIHFGVPLAGSRPRAVPVFRWKWPDGVPQPVDTILGEKVSATANGVMRIVPFTFADAVGTLADGTRVTFRATTRSVEWVRPDGRTDRQPFPGMQEEIPSSVKERVRPIQLQREIDRFYPPFDPNSLVVSSRGRAWVQAVPSRGDSVVWYGFSRTERELHRLVLDRLTTIAFISEPFIVLVRRLDDDTEQVEVRRLR